MNFLKKPITVLYILFALIVLNLSFQNCSSPFESVSGNGSFGAGSDSLSFNEVQSLEIFERTLYPKLEQNCAQCHGVNQAPLFAVPNSLDAHRLVFNKELVNLETPENSFMAIKIRAGHQNFDVELATEFVASINDWSAELKAAIDVPDNLPEEEVNPELPNENNPAELPVDPVVDPVAPAPGEPVVDPAPAPPEQPASDAPAAPIPPVTPPVDTATFSFVNNKIIIPKCLNCHKPRDQGGFGLEDDYTSYELTISTGSVVPGDSAASAMYNEVLNGKMPPSGASLSEDEVELIRAWIDAGALNN